MSTARSTEVEPRSESADAPDRMGEIAVCALTHRRPDGLERLLVGLRDLTFRDAVPRIRVVIVDNDPASSGRPVCERLAPTLPWPLEYTTEPRPGIAFARNAALTRASGSDWICFIDDDEVPRPDWLDNLLRARERFSADVVGGPVAPHFPEPVDPWIVSGGFFERRRHATGTPLPHAFTNNVLFRARILDDLHLRFNERWALMGCEDRAFFQTIGMAGYKIVWADDAEVVEWIPPGRANRPWLVRRMYRVGNSTSFVELDLRPKWRTVPLLLAKSAAWLLIGLARLAAGTLGGKARRVRGLQACAYAAGMAMGALGVPFEEYRRKASG